MTKPQLIRKKAEAALLALCYFLSKTIFDLG
jgi:hypothetical protein